MNTMCGHYLDILNLNRCFVVLRVEEISPFFKKLFMSIEEIVKEVEEEHTDIAYVYVKDGKEFFTPNLRVAIKRNESNSLVIINNGEIVKEIEILK